MKKTSTKTVIALVVITMVSVVGFGTAFGYGGGSVSGGSVSGGSVSGGSVSGGSVSGSRRVIVTPVVAPAGKILGASTFAFTSHLRKGASSDAVKQLQERLRAEGHFTYETSTGYFGPITFAAVQAYQAKHGIPSTGFVGPLTIAELNK